jgi:hypothetical protein
VNNKATTSRAIYLYFYTDSVAFPRLADQSVDMTWPFLLTEMLREDLGARVYPCLRGLGGGKITDVQRLFLADSGYFRAQGNDTSSFVIFNTGIVDAAPQPFTYCLRVMARIPRIGPPAWNLVQKLLGPHRVWLQRLFAYRQTSRLRFVRVFDRMVRLTKRAGMISISLDTPLTPASLESRSPGLRASIDEYNALKHRNTDTIHVAMDWVGEDHYLECGHHFNAAGHRETAQRLMVAIKATMTRKH